MLGCLQGQHCWPGTGVCGRLAAGNETGTVTAHETETGTGTELRPRQALRLSTVTSLESANCSS